MGIAANTSSILSNNQALDILQTNLNAYIQENDLQMINMQSDYSQGVATAIAMGQMNLSGEGLSLGISYGSYNGRHEKALGIGYGATLKSGNRFQINASKNNLATGVGMSINFK